MEVWVVDLDPQNCDPLNGFSELKFFSSIAKVKYYVALQCHVVRFNVEFIPTDKGYTDIIDTSTNTKLGRCKKVC